jgi:hypothetical protein
MKQQSIAHNPVDFKFLLPFDLDKHSATCLDGIANYFGSIPYGYFVYAQHSNSNLIDKANYQYMVNFLDDLKDVYGYVDYEQITLNHWLVGYVNYLILDFTNYKQVLIDVDSELSKLVNYPVFDDDLLYQLSQDCFKEYEKYYLSTHLIDLLPISDSLNDYNILDYWELFKDSDYCEFEYEVDYYDGSVTIDESGFIDFMLNETPIFQEDKELFYAYRNEYQLSLFHY